MTVFTIHKNVLIESVEFLSIVFHFKMFFCYLDSRYSDVATGTGAIAGGWVHRSLTGGPDEECCVGSWPAAHQRHLQVITYKT